MFDEKQQQEVELQESLCELEIKKEIEEQALFYQQALDEIKNNFELWKLTSKTEQMPVRNEFMRFHNHQLTDDCSNEIDLSIDFDFGFSTTKVVIGDKQRKDKKYPIKFGDQPEDTYLKSTSIFIKKKTFNFSAYIV